eukprot:GILK01005987.1.p1 GENE.GILK01005987.1~~GILK01005987.1.p1  ORF type:complete len:298 (-),score=44.76 GILK01005987.1:370-1233(-)
MESTSRARYSSVPTNYVEMEEFEVQNAQNTQTQLVLSHPQHNPLPTNAAPSPGSCVQIILENPDGTFYQGIDPHAKPPESSPQEGSDTSSPSSVDSSSNHITSSIASDDLPFRLTIGYDSDFLLEDIFNIYRRHSSLFVSLLIGQLALEVVFHILFVMYAKAVLAEVSTLYPLRDSGVLKLVLWGSFVVNLLYNVVYFATGIWGATNKNPQHLRSFAFLAMLGILGQMMMVYFNEFNLLLFFMRLIAYVYSRFLLSILLSVAMMPLSNHTMISAFPVGRRDRPSLIM